MNEVVLNAISDILTKAVIPFVVSGVVSYAGFLLIKIKTKIKNNTVKMALDQLTKITTSVVQSLMKDVEVLKAKNPDGKLTKIDEDAIKTKAIQRIKDQMQNEFLDILAQNNINVDERISTEIESKIFELKPLVCNDSI